MSIVSSYLGNVFNPHQLKYTVQACVRTLKKHKLEFDAIAFRGMSGAIVAPMVAAKLNKPLILVRKPNDGTHSCYVVEGYLNPCKYVIVDDFVAGGTTVESIHQAINDKAYGPCTCVAVLAYLRQQRKKPSWSDDSEESVVKERLGNDTLYLRAFTPTSYRKLEQLA